MTLIFLENSLRQNYLAPPISGMRSIKGGTDNCQASVMYENKIVLVKGKTCNLPFSLQGKKRANFQPFPLAGSLPYDSFVTP